MTSIDEQELNNSIILELEKINISSVKRRIFRELSELQKENAYIYVEYNEDSCDNNVHLLTINIVLYGTCDLISFQVCRSYPFKPPKNIKINYRDYNSFLKIYSLNTIEQIREVYKKYYKKKLIENCLCCSSISCFANWVPTMKIINVVKEIQTLKKIRRAIIDKLLASKIIKKYLINDFGFSEYFYSFLFYF